MEVNSQLIDKFSITISGLCVAHCLLFPILAVLAPSFLTVALTSESFHFWMVVAVIPSSLIALALGCKKHKEITMFIMGAVGLSCLLLALTLGSATLGESGEKVLTLIGALVIAFAHFKNFKLCQHSDNCECPSQH